MQKEWLSENTPGFDCPDPILTETYRFRWQTFSKHMKSTPDGFVVTEFAADVPWAGRYNTINCAAGHHFYEGRWLRDPRYLSEYARFWFGPSGDPRNYSFWAADSIYAYSLVNGDVELIKMLLPDLVHNYRAWEEKRQDSSGLFWQYDNYDGMEYSIGGSGYRATINSYMYGDAVAIARIAAMMGDDQLAAEFTEKANTVKRLVQEQLWDPEDSFFKVKVNEVGLAYTKNQPAAWVNQLNEGQLRLNQLVDVCELHGYVPWYFNLPDSGFERAWKKLRDPSGFEASYGPTTTEQRHPLFMCHHTHECLWNGPSWPYATTQLLVAMANLLRNYDQNYVTVDDYFTLLRRYASCHRILSDDGEEKPWIDENLDPYTGEWIARNRLYERNDPLKDRGANYNHSGFCDLIISGLMGIQPRADAMLQISPLLPQDTWDYFRLDSVPYHGRLVTVQYDRTGSRYEQGAGFRVFVDGILRASEDTVRPLLIPLN